MTTIERRVEAAKIVNPDYSGKTYSDADVAAGKHRGAIGGRWETHGLHQLNFLLEQGLTPHMRFLDVGCGSLRAGRHLVDALEPGHYYGIDANLSLMQAGYDIELTDEQRTRLPITNLRANDRFDGDFGVQFDMAIAQSVFTHVSLNHMRLCLYRTAKVLRPGGKFYVTFFERPPATPVDKIFLRSGARARPNLGEQNVFWYYRADMEWAATYGPWRFRYIGEWGHPVHQKMVEYTRLTDEQWAAQKVKLGAGTTKSAAPKTRPEQARRFVARGLRYTARHIDTK